MSLKFVTVSEKGLHMPFVVQCIFGGRRGGGATGKEKKGKSKKNN
jgi:hypothetical protein